MSWVVRLPDTRQRGWTRHALCLWRQAATHWVGGGLGLTSGWDLGAQILTTHPPPRLCNRHPRPCRAALPSHSLCPAPTHQGCSGVGAHPPTPASATPAPHPDDIYTECGTRCSSGGCVTAAAAIPAIPIAPPPPPDPSCQPAHRVKGYHPCASTFYVTSPQPSSFISSPRPPRSRATVCSALLQHCRCLHATPRNHPPAPVRRVVGSVYLAIVR